MSPLWMKPVLECTQLFSSEWGLHSAADPLDVFQFVTVDLVRRAGAVLFPVAAPGVASVVILLQVRSSPAPCSRAHSMKQVPSDAIARCCGTRRHTTTAKNTEKTFTKRMSDSLLCDAIKYTER